MLGVACDSPLYSSSRSLGAVLDAEAKLEFHIEPGKRAAYLIMDSHQTVSLPTQGFWTKIAELKELKDMYIVTDIMICSAYALGLTSKGMMLCPSPLSL